ncbi:hypothetical protein [Sphingomonas sp.]|uniref:hypothetical protein n=1 Tax=Sphingomonas sp. TaxID=28214 RepID=UPI001B1456CB|nr:hypothetical protein [Sphingomonas sp.]MBO9711579.1 hypothetical protein [Sphingomonas sp.]
MSEAIYGPIATAIGAAIFGWLLLSGFKSGRLEWPYYAITLSGRRADQPSRFWVLAFAMGLLILMLIIGTIAQIAWPNGL